MSDFDGPIPEGVDEALRMQGTDPTGNTRPKMTRSKALGLIQKYYSRPVFNVKIGICSPQVTDVTFEEALEELDRCAKYSTEYMEYVYIYPSDFLKDFSELNEALLMFNLGAGRAKLNQQGLYT